MLKNFVGRHVATQQSGFRAIQHSCCSYPTYPAEELYHELFDEISGCCLLLRCTARELLVVESKDCTTTDTFPLNIDTDDLICTDSQSLVIFIDDFQEIGFLGQQKLLASLREKREEGRKIRLVVAGKWCYHEFVNKWNEASNSGQPIGSPPFNGVLTLNGYTCNDIKNNLQKYLTDNLSIDYYCDLLWRMTSGDKDLIEIVEEYLSSHSAEHPERLFDSLDDIASVHQLVLHRCNNLSQRSKEILSATLRTQRIRLSHDDIDAELLYLKGLLRKSDDKDIGERAVWEISSPTIAFALLKSWKDCYGNTFNQTRELLPPLQAAASEAYEIICHTENLLRNMLCLAIGYEPGKDLHSELLKLLPKEQQDKATQRLGRDYKERDISLRQTLSSYLDLDALATALCTNKTIEVGIGNIFSDAITLRVKLDEFARIRIHVAHGRPVSFCIVRELKELRKWFEVALAEGGHKSLIKAELSRFPINIVNRRIDGKPPRLLLTIENRSDKSLPINTKIVVFIDDIWRSKPISVHLAAGKQTTVSFEFCMEINSVDIDNLNYELCI